MLMALHLTIQKLITYFFCVGSKMIVFGGTSGSNQKFNEVSAMEVLTPDFGCRSVFLPGILYHVFKLACEQGFCP